MTDNRRKAAAGFIFATILLDVLGIGLIVPVLPTLVTEFVGGDPSVGARYFGPIVAVFALMQFLFAPILGALSDRFGRRPILLVALFGYGVDYIVMGLAPTLAWLVGGRIFAGILGATITTANAYLADISTPETRARNFGLVGAAFGLGFIFGPSLGGVLGEISPRLPFFAAAGLVFINWLYGYFVLPESLPPEHRRSVEWSALNPLGVLARLGQYPLALGLAMSFVLLGMAQRGLEAVWVLHATERYGWSELENGLSLALVGLLAAVNQGFTIRKVVPRFGERKVIVFGLSLSAVAFLGYALADQAWMVFVVMPIGSLGGLAVPAMQGLITSVVKPDQQGAIQGALTSLRSAVAIVAPLVATGLFALFTSRDDLPYLPGAPFYLGAAFIVGAGLIAATQLRRHHL